MGTITIKDIAKKCGVGVSTVSRAMNNHPDISEETKKKVMDVIKENDFVPNNSARNLKRSETRTIAVLIKGISNPFFQGMFKVLEEEIQRKRYTFILQRVDSKQDEADVALALVKEKRLKGIVFLGGTFVHSAEKLKRLQVPFVLCTIDADSTIDRSIYSSVSVDDVKESCKIVDYLCSCGHKKIAILLEKDDECGISCLRFCGYEQALKKHGISVNPKLLRYAQVEGDFYTMKNGYDMTKKLLESGEEFTAIYTISDSMAIGACKAIFEAGKRVPEDYSIAGFDGLDIAYYYEPSITTIRQPVEEMAREAITILFDRIKKRGPNQHRKFDGELVIQQSTKSM